MLIGSLGTIFQCLGTYGIDALRDAVLWGYGFFALLTASFMLRLKTIWKIVFAYQKIFPLVTVLDSDWGGFVSFGN